MATYTVDLGDYFGKIRKIFEDGQKRIEEDIIKITEELAKIEKNKEQTPAWKPEDLIGKLVRAWNNGIEPYVGVLSPINGIGTMPHVLVHTCFQHIEPLTEAEALALVWRKPGALICPHCHREAFYASSHDHYARVVCSECGADWCPPVTQKPKTRYDWSKAPEWAKCAARDANGNAWFYDSCDHDYGDMFWKNTSNAHSGYPMPSSCIFDASGDWRDSLERRPK